MKVGTDGVLIGAWCQHFNAERILDVGTGTGLISLMLAQRFSSAKISAIEIDELSSIEANFNIKSSQWKDRIECLHLSLQEFNSEEKYDLIVSNPPFFEGTTKSGNESRDAARHNSSLSYYELIQKSQTLLAKDGCIALVFPFDKYDKISSIAEDLKLNQKRVCYIKGNSETKIKRVLLELTNLKVQKEESQLVIEVSRNNYTEEYKKLCKDFYLKF